MLGYMEQTVALAITKALTAVGTAKPKYPFVSATKSALIYAAYHLKGKYTLYCLQETAVQLEFNTINFTSGERGLFLFNFMATMHAFNFQGWLFNT